jgi:hypothetical protein
MANVIVPGTVAAEPGTMTRAMLDAIEALLDPAIFAASEVGLARIANAIAVGWTGNVVASIDDTKYLQVDGGDIIGGTGGGGGGGAPTNAEYLVATSNGTLTDERVATNTASVIWDFATAGQAKATVPDATTAAKGIVELATDGEVAAGVVVQGNDGRLSDARTPTAHAASHENSGGDEINVTGLSGVLADPQTPTTHGSSHASDGSDPIPAATTSVRGTVELATSAETTAGLAVQASDTRLSDARTPTAHATSHQNGGGDEINVAGLSGVLADPQTPASHGSSHASNGSDPIPAATTSVRGTVELATSAETTAGLAVQASDTRLSDARVPTNHAPTHEALGGDELDVTTLAGYPGGGTTFLRDDGTFATPAGGGISAGVAITLGYIP